jgi:hypothetical protein
MKSRVSFLLCLATVISVAVYLGCGSSSTDTVPVDQTVLDNAGYALTDPTATGMSTGDDGSSDVVTQLEGDNGVVQQELLACHPHLFARTQEVVRLFNRHFYKALRHTVAIISSKATKSAQNNSVFIWIRTKTFTGSAGGDAGVTTTQVTLRITLTKNSATSFDYKMEMKNASDADTAYVQVLGGHIDAIAGAARQGTGTMDINFSALGTFDPAERAGGSVHVVFKNAGNNHYVWAKLTNVIFDNDPRRVPRNDNFVHVRAKGVGGSNKFSDALNLYCPPNPTNLVASLNTVSRWRVQTGVVTGRSDSQATGGQIPSGYTWAGLTCHTYQGPTDAGAASAEGYWQMKETNQNGSIVYADAEGVVPSSSCDAAFGPIPTPQGPGPDFNFGALNMGDGSWVAFPGSTGIAFYP